MLQILRRILGKQKSSRSLFTFAQTNKETVQQQFKTQQFIKTCLIKSVPSFYYSNETVSYWKQTFSKYEMNDLLNLQNKLNGSQCTIADIELLISQRYFKDLLVNNLVKLPIAQERERKQKINQIIVNILSKTGIGQQNLLKLYEQTMDLDEVQKQFIDKIIKTPFSVEEKVLKKYVEFTIRNYELLIKSGLNNFKAETLLAFLSNINLDNFPLWDLSLLLEIDNIVFEKRFQLELMNVILKKIFLLKNNINENDIQGLLEVLRFTRRRRIRLGKDAKILFHLAECLPIQILSQAMIFIKLSNYEYEEVIRFYGFLTKKYFATYNLQNIDLLNIMNVYMPAQTAANFYLADLHQKFEEGNYMYLIEKLPAYINLFHPSQSSISYLSDKVSLKLASSIYSMIEQSQSCHEREYFFNKLSKLLSALLHGDLLKNDFFLVRTLQFITKMIEEGIQERDSLYAISYFVNHINYEHNQLLQTLVEQINIISPPREPKQSQSNTQTKIFKFLLQTNYYALQNVKIGTFTADILVHPNLIIEYNGYHHYKFDLKQKGYKFDQFTLQHIFRENQMKKKHPQYKIVNINFRTWHSLQDLEKQYKFLSDLVSKNE